MRRHWLNPRPSQTASAAVAPPRPAASVQTPTSPTIAASDDSAGGFLPPGRKANSGQDASGLYKDAFALYAQLSEEEKKILSNPKDEVDEEKAAALFAKLQPIMDLLRRAAALPECDWGYGQYRFDMPLPHLAKSQELGKAALWVAAYRFPTDPRGAVADLQARAQLGHQLSDLLIGALVDASFEKSASDLILANASLLDATALQDVNRLLETTARDHAARAFEGELQGARAMITQLAEASPEKRAELLNPSGSSTNDASLNEQMQAVRRQFDGPGAAAAQREHLEQTYKQLVESLQWPDARFREWWSGAQSAAEAYPFEKVALSMLGGIRDRLQRSAVENQMLATGLAVLQNGEPQVAGSRDPSTGAPFTYVETAAGFELRSQFLYKGKPLNMTFPRPAQPAR